LEEPQDPSSTDAESIGEQFEALPLEGESPQSQLVELEIEALPGDTTPSLRRGTFPLPGSSQKIPSPLFWKMEHPWSPPHHSMEVSLLTHGEIPVSPARNLGRRTKQDQDH
jgi:hypothetical protein